MPNRIIRFRVWNKDKEEMIEISELVTLRLEEKGRWFAFNQDETLYCNYLNGELHQFTALFDKRGVPIYEGDIVKSHAFLDSTEEFNCEVKWIAGGFVANGSLGVNHELVEVIGNIWEHPELLKV